MDQRDFTTLFLGSLVARLGGDVEIAASDMEKINHPGTVLNVFPDSQRGVFRLVLDTTGVEGRTLQ